MRRIAQHAATLRAALPRVSRLLCSRLLCSRWLCSRQLRSPLLCLRVLGPCLLACSGLSDPYRAAPEWSPHTYGRGGPTGADLAGAQLRSEVCAGQDLRPDYARLSEADLVQFLQAGSSDVTVERPRGDLAYVSFSEPGGKKLRLRVAVLGSADEAGRELARAIAQHGKGSWGVHRSNLAVLGPAREPEQVIELVSTTKLACWGVFTLGSGEDVYVIPGGYREL